MLQERATGVSILLVCVKCFPGSLPTTARITLDGSVYWAQMISLNESNPDAHDMLMYGYMAVQRNRHHGFGQVPVDQTIEQALKYQDQRRDYWVQSEGRSTPVVANYSP